MTGYITPVRAYAIRPYGSADVPDTRQFNPDGILHGFCLERIQAGAEIYSDPDSSYVNSDISN